MFFMFTIQRVTGSNVKFRRYPEVMYVFRKWPEVLEMWVLIISLKELTLSRRRIQCTQIARLNILLYPPLPPYRLALTFFYFPHLIFLFYFSSSPWFPFFLQICYLLFPFFLFLFLFPLFSLFIFARIFKQ